ncbi:MAG: FMN-binding protein [Clostridia bacterium]|nr:FMN-binding protein [Clostridia bacterium]
MRKPISLLLACLLLPAVLTGCRAGADQHTGTAEGYGGPLTVAVTMNGTDITKVQITQHTETEGVGTRAIDALPAAIEKADSIDVDSVSGATVTSNAIKEAVSSAIGLSGRLQDVIPMNNDNAAPAAPAGGLRGAGMAATGRVGPGKDAEGGQVYSFNVVFAAGEFDEDGVIRAMKVDQLEVVTPNLGGGSAFSGFPDSVGEEEAFLREVSAWTTKGAQREGYRLASGTWREQMDAYEQAMIGKTVDEVKTQYAGGNGSSDVDSSNTADATVSETEVTDAADAGAAQPVHDMANVSMAGTDAVSGATMSLQSEYGDILLAIERAWEDAQKSGTERKLTDTNTVTDAADGESSMG